MERMSRVRAAALLAIFALVMVLYALRLFKLQVIEGNADNMTTYTTVTTVRAARGDILDRNGTILVGNRASYDLVFNHFVIKSADNRNEHLYNLMRKCEELGITHEDHFPVSYTPPFEYTLDSFTSAWQGYFRDYMVDCNLDSDITAPLLLEQLRERYKIPQDWTDQQAREVIGLRYEFDLRGISNLASYVFIEDVDSDDLSALLELNTPGLMVESSTVREYHTKYAAHILGYMGGMDDADWAKYQDKNYSMDALIGQAGMEEAFEDYLHGIDGTRLDRVSKEGTIIEQYYVTDKDGNVKAPVAGNSVETTIDINLQKITEDTLADFMANITDENRQNPAVDPNGKDARDAEGAAVVVMKVKTGEVLACASYPTYDISTMMENWKEIEENPLKPFFNRAFGANYAPGSAYKMSTLVAAMLNGFYKPGDTIMDEGVFTKYPGFNPKCLIYTQTQGGSTHGELKAEEALAVSCNYFFYVLGDTLNIEMLDAAAKGLGLGEPTGIELTEKIGWRSNPESKAATYTGSEATFGAGDRILTAIGQAENRFSPLQLCVYVSTLANKGTRMKATFLSRVVSSDYRTLVYENEPQVVSQLPITDEIYNTYVQGMREVVTYPSGGTANKYFDGPRSATKSFPVTVCAKTGTAEHASGGSDNASFVCFAPMEDPEIAIAIFCEKGAHGSWLAPVAENILREYYAMTNASDVFTEENQTG